MKNTHRPRAYVLYGNHGDSPHQLGDYLEYFTQIFTSMGVDTFYSRDPVPGFLNIAIECFDANYLQKMKRCTSVENTKFVLIATEFITGSTFNAFEKSETAPAVRSNPKVPFWVKNMVNLTMWFLFPPRLRDFTVGLFPGPYLKAKELYLAQLSTPQRSPYDNKGYWSKRFLNFSRALEIADEVWCVSPHQVEAYRSFFVDQEIGLLPIASWAPAPTNALQGCLEKDVDFLFTGSVTPYRETILKELTARGYKVVLGTAIWPTLMRENFIARAKICLHIKQDPNWKYPSIMRYHYLLCAGALVVAEESLEHCMQEDFLTLSSPQNFVSTCERLIKESNFLEKGDSASRRYYDASASAREETCKMLSKYFKNGAKINVLEPSHSHG